jgi:hypothetical protein
VEGTETDWSDGEVDMIKEVERQALKKRTQHNKFESAEGRFIRLLRVKFNKLVVDVQRIHPTTPSMGWTRPTDHYKHQ